MRAVLLFPPHASPTYTPLGVATLAAHARTALPDLQLSVLDLNITAWHHVIAGDPAAAATLDFFRSASGFYDRAAYLEQQRRLHALDGRLQALAADGARYLETGEASPEVARLLDDQVAAVLRGDPELVGISLVFLDQAPLGLALTRRLIEHAGEARPPRIIVGGAAISALHEGELLAACPWIDGVVAGEGEAAWEALCRNQPREAVPGLVFRTAGGLHHNTHQAALSLRQLPVPDFSDLAANLYLNPEPVLPVLFSRGCAWRRCRFCAHNLSFASYRRKRAEEFAAELETLQRRWHARAFYIADQYIGASDLETIARALAGRGLDLRLHAMGRPVAGYTAARLERLASAGLCWISWGVESGSQRLLDVIDKGTRVPAVEQVIRDAHQAGISNLLMMIFGLPTSTDEDLDLTLAFLARLEGSFDALTLSRFTLFERTFFGRNATRFGLQPTGGERLFAPLGISVRTRRLTFKEIAADGSLRPPRGALEIAAARRRLGWLTDLSFLSDIACEHYLLHAGTFR